MRRACELSHIEALRSKYPLVGPTFQAGGAAARGSDSGAAPSSCTAILKPRAHSRRGNQICLPDDLLLVSGQGTAMPIYRVLAAPENVTYVFDAADDEEAERFARQLSLHSRPGGTGCMRVENLAGDAWRRVCAWKPGG